MKLNPETFARASSRHPWRTVAAWVVAIVGMGALSSTLLSGVLTDDVAFTNRPESARAQDVINAKFGNAAEDTEFLVVRSETRRWGQEYAAFIQQVKGDTEALGPSVLAGPVTTYADAEAMQQLLFTPDGHGLLSVLQIVGDPAPVIARLNEAVAKAAPANFQASVLSAEQVAKLSGTPSSAPKQADPPEAFLVVQSTDLAANGVQFLFAIQQLETVVVQSGGADLAAPPFDEFDAQRQASALISTDRKTTLVLVPVADVSDAIVTDLRAVAARASNDTYTVQVAGQAALQADFMKLAKDDMKKSESIGLAVALIVLIVVFGSIIAALLPLVMGLFAISVALGLVALVGQVFQFNLVVENMVTMIGLAVGIDYSLFIVSRYREERKKGFVKLEAIGRSGATASRAVFFSGLTVVFALLGMLIIPVSIFRSLAGGAIFVTIAAIAASMTLLPAILALLGDRINWPRLARRARVDTAYDPKGGFWDRLTRGVMAKPVVFLVASVLVLGTLGAFYFQLHRGTTQNVSALPAEFPSRQAFLTLVQEFDMGGASDPAQIVISGDVASPSVQSAVENLKTAIAADPAFSSQTETSRSKDGTTLMLSAYFAGDPLNDVAFQGIRDLRSTIVPTAMAGATGVSVIVGGNTAIFTDFLSLVDRYQWIVVAFVLTLSFLLLTVVFRSIVVPIKAILMNLLSVGAAYGAVTLVFQKGFGIGVFDAMGFPFKRVEAIEAWLPLFLFSVLFGLSMDYHVFLLTRIREEYDKTGDNTEAVAYGLRTTAGMITGAALIMVAVFASFAAGRLEQLQQMGFGLAVAVLMDATIVRVLLVPASMRLLGDWNWYLPSWLQWLPRLRVEGAETEVPAPAPELAPLEVTKPREPVGR
jgi:putative drug exporter of the RND superfamily